MNYLNVKLEGGKNIPSEESPTERKTFGSLRDIYLTVNQSISRRESIYTPKRNDSMYPQTESHEPSRRGSMINPFDPLEEILYEMFKDENERLSMQTFLVALTKNGIKKSDPRLEQMYRKLNAIVAKKSISIENLSLDKDEFKSVIHKNIELIRSALNNDFIIPNFEQFSKAIEDIYWKCRINTGGKVASYIPQLAKYTPDFWGVSVCTIDGQRFSIGDTGTPFTIQSTCKPITYGIALNVLGPDVVHSYVGQEPSGRMFNELVLDHNRKPHNPMVNAGAIVVCSLLCQLAHADMRIAEKFDWVCSFFKLMTGGKYLSFNNSTFLSERESADRNFAIAYYMKENKCFPPNTEVKDVLDFYFQMCSLEVTADSLCIVAGTLANGGICPITGEKILTTESVRDVLSLMHSCGMYDYSGQFAFKIGLPAKSGVSGSLMIVIPNVMGICCWSPPLDSYGNSVRGVQFCQELVSIFNFHHYDDLLHCTHKIDPRRQQKFTINGTDIVNLLFAAEEGDLSAMKRHYLSGMDMELRDYDGRTALHLAAAEGHLECIQFLLKCCSVNPNPRDRWDNTPLDDAKKFGHNDVCLYLEQWHNPNQTAINNNTINTNMSNDKKVNDSSDNYLSPQRPSVTSLDKRRTSVSAFEKFVNTIKN